MYCTAVLWLLILLMRETSNDREGNENESIKEGATRAFSISLYFIKRALLSTFRRKAVRPCPSRRCRHGVEDDELWSNRTCSAAQLCEMPFHPAIAISITPTQVTKLSSRSSPASNLQ